MKIGGVTTARGSGRRSQSRRDRRCSSNTATSPSKISVEVGNNAIATASSRNRPREGDRTQPLRNRPRARRGHFVVISRRYLLIHENVQCSIRARGARGGPG